MFRLLLSWSRKRKRWAVKGLDVGQSGFASGEFFTFLEGPKLDTTISIDRRVKNPLTNDHMVKALFHSSNEPMISGDGECTTVP